YYSTDEFVRLVNKVSLGLLQMGVKPGDKIALISYNNRPEWNIMDMGMMQIGAINVPVYPTISPSDYIFIFNDASVKYCIVGHGDLLEKVRTAQKEIPSLQAIFTFDEADSKGQTDA
ncbi:MAG: AMP-binding protein, partial [bacterium]